MSDDTVGFVVCLLIVLWAVLWYWVGTRTYRWDAYKDGQRDARLKSTNDAYRRGLEAGLKVEHDSLKGKVQDPDNEWYLDV